ncbi:MAG: ABC transporter ATP-binding protein [Thermococci archaeon]|nr:ABC transporter ATP-binding protein [Thermococci archaeon]
MAEVELRDVRRDYEGFSLRLSLRVRDGEMMVILGPSGCGKTTTLRIIAGLERPDSGRVLFDGNDVTNLEPYERDIGIVFQDYALFPHMTVFRNVAFGLEMRRLPRDEVRRKVRWALELVGLEGFEDRYPEQLSGGQQQRVALARALVTEPEVLLLDEPLSNLDAKIREHLRLRIREIQRELGITAVYVTHDQEEAMAISDRIAVMNVGRIEQVGRPVEVYYNPKNDFVANFLGRSNVLRLRARGGRACLGSLCFRTEMDGDVVVFFRPEHVFVKRGDDAEVIGYEVLPGRIRLRLRIGEATITAERFLHEVPFSPEDVPDRVGVSVVEYRVRGRREQEDI